MQACRSHSRLGIGLGEEPAARPATLGAIGASGVARARALVSTARALPGDASLSSARRPVGDATADLPRVAAWLDGVAAAMNARLPAALSAAERAWDQADRLSLLDAAAVAELNELRTPPTLEGSAEAQTAQRAAGQLAAMALSVAIGWIDLFEKRLATLLRLRTRQGEPIFEADRPFLDPAPLLQRLAHHLRGAGRAPTQGDPE